MIRILFVYNQQVVCLIVVFLVRRRYVQRLDSIGMFYDPDKNGTVNNIPAGFIPTWSLSGSGGTLGTPTSDGDSVSVTAGALCETEYTVKIELKSTSGFGDVSCDTTVEVNVIQTSLSTARMIKM